MTRLLVVLLAVAGALLGPAGPAAAHGGEAPDATAYRITVTGVEPALPGLTVRVVEAGTRLELTNDTGRAIEILGYAGEPYLEVRPDGTYENADSPATYRNRTLAGDTVAPESADPAAPPRWRRVSGSTTVRWHDQRVQWRGADPPPAARADPSRPHRLRAWVVPLRDQTRELAVRGTLDWQPPPRTWLWWAGALALAVLVLVIGPAPLVAALAGAVVVAAAVARTLDAGPPLVLFAAGIVALAAAAWRSPFGFALGGGVLLLFAGIAEAGVLRAAVVPAAGPAWFARLAVLVALGAGAGLLGTGIRRLRRAPELSEARSKVVP